MTTTTKDQEIKALAIELSNACLDIVSQIDKGIYKEVNAFRDYNRIRYEYMVVLLDMLMDYDKKGEH